jgi:DHA1 family tetracycline resistance protein-like MFS transporter
MTATGAPRKPALAFIFVTLLLSIMGFGLLIPVMPRLVTEFRQGNESEGALYYGWLVGIFSLMQFIASPVLGALSDRFGRRRIILISTAGAAIDYMIMANAPTLTWLFIARIISGVTAGVLATANAYVVDVTDQEKRAQAFGVIGAAFGLGFMLGPALGGFLGKFDLRLPFWFAAGCAALNWLWGFFMLPESLRPENRRRFEWSRANPLGAVAAIKRFPAVLGLIDCYFIWWLAQTMLQSTWVLYTGKRYGWDTMQTGLSLMTAGVLMSIVQAVFVKRLVPRLGERRAVLVGLAVTICAFIAYGCATRGWMVYAVMIFASIAGISGPALQTYITKHVPANEQGSVQGVLTGLASLANIPGPFIATWSFAWAVAPQRSRPFPGIAFFEAAALILLAAVLAARSFAKDAHAAVGVTASSNG